MLGVSEMKRVVREGGSVSAYKGISLGRPLIKMIHRELRNYGIDYPLPPSAAVSKMENLEKLWAEAGLKSIESKQINVERSFVDFEEFWNVTKFFPLYQLVFDDLEPDLLWKFGHLQKRSFNQRFQKELAFIYEAHANAIKGIV